MKKNLFVAAILGMMLVLGMMVVGCADGTPGRGTKGGGSRSNPYIGENDFLITGTVHGLNSTGAFIPLTSNITAVKVKGTFNDPLEAILTGDNGFYVDISTPSPSKLESMTKANLTSEFRFTNENCITTLTPSDAKFSKLFFEATAAGYNPELQLTTESARGVYFVYDYVYVDKDVTVKASDPHLGDSFGLDYIGTIDLSLKKGWNVMECESTEVGITYRVKGILESAAWHLF